MYSRALNIPAIEEEGVRQLAAGKGIDRNIMLDHMTRIQRDGLLCVLWEESERVKPMTVHPHPDLLSHPPDRIPMLPVVPHSDSVALVSDAQREVIAQHRAMVPVEQPRPVRAPLVISDVTRARMLPYTTELSLDEKLHLLATVGGKFLVSDDFVPNDGTNVRPYPPSTSPRAATEAHMGGNLRKGRVIV